MLPLCLKSGKKRNVDMQKVHTYESLKYVMTKSNTADKFI